MADLVDYEWLTSEQTARLLQELADDCSPTLQKQNRLRKTLSSERARLAIQQLELRSRAITKFGNLASRMFFSDLSLQQATDWWIARYKAARVTHSTPVVDYCCGIGGDLLAFAARSPSTGWDRASEIVHLANANLQAIQANEDSQAQVGLVEEQTLVPEQIWHLDPDRRTEGRRSTQIEWHSPGPELIERWLTINPNGILKLAPATKVPIAWAEQAELEWITRDRQCRQQVVWFGELAQGPGKRRATSLQKTTATETFEPASFTGSPHLQAPLTEKVARYIYDTDPAVRAAGLTGAIAVENNLLAFNNGASYLTSDHAVRHPLLTCFEVLDQFPLRQKTLINHFRNSNIGQLEIKKRGVDTDPEQLRKKLKLRGSESTTLLLTRLDTSETAILARRYEG